MKILLTGGAGFIGSHLTDRLVADGHSVGVIDDLSSGYIRNLNKKIYFWEFDLRNYEVTKTILNHFQPEVIYHLATNAAESKSQFCPYDICTRNYVTSLTLLSNSINKGLKKFIYTSSEAVYGKELGRPFKETDVPNPVDLYGASKLATEKAILLLSQVHEFEYVIVRPHNIYGTRQDMADPYRNAVTIFMNQILKDKPYCIFGDGEQRRQFSYIKDVANALQNCLNAKQGIYNLGTDKSYSVNELSDAIMEITGFNQKPINLPARVNEVQICEADNRLARKYLAYRDTISFKEGIERTWEYALKLGPQELRTSDFEIMSPKIPKNWL
jgi:UDP-glucose 4-epimerase